MIRLYTGKLGAGKSYAAVYHIWRKLRDSGYDCVVVTNIDSFYGDDNRIIHIECTRDTEKKRWLIEGKPDFFEWGHFETYCAEIRELHNLPKTSKIYFLIDEAQRFLPPRKVDTGTSYSFEISRHEGLEFWLITQDRRKIDQSINVLVEEEYRAVNPRKNILPKKFIYNHLIDGEVYSRTTLTKKQEVFALYSSQTCGKPEVKPNKWVFILIGCLIFTAIAFYRAINLFAPDEPVAPPSAEKIDPAPAPSAPPEVPRQRLQSDPAPHAQVKQSNWWDDADPRPRPKPAVKNVSMATSDEVWDYDDFQGRVPVIVGFDFERRDLLMKDGYPAQRIPLSAFLNAYACYGYGALLVGDQLRVTDKWGRAFVAVRGRTCVAYPVLASPVDETEAERTRQMWAHYQEHERHSSDTSTGPGQDQSNRVPIPVTPATPPVFDRFTGYSLHQPSVEDEETNTLGSNISPTL